MEIMNREIYEVGYLSKEMVVTNEIKQQDNKLIRRLNENDYCKYFEILNSIKQEKMKQKESLRKIRKKIRNLIKGMTTLAIITVMNSGTFLN